MGKVFKDKPINEITLRKFERPLNENKEELIRKFCISLGLLQPGDSRDVIVDILNLLISAKKEKKIFSSKEIEDEIKKKKSLGVAPSNIRRQVLRLEKAGLIDKKDGGYRIKEFSELPLVLEDIKQFLIEPAFERIKEYAEMIEKL